MPFSALCFAGMCAVCHGAVNVEALYFDVCVFLELVRSPNVVYNVDALSG